jgi:glycosyltransferase involved in cell wall biosynthesis
MYGLAGAHRGHRFVYYYRPHRFLRSFQESVPANAGRRLLRGAPRVDLFHALNQRVDTRARITVATFHDLFVMTSEYSSAEFRSRFTEQAREAAAKSDAIITVSQYTADQVHHLLGVEFSRIHVVPHGVHVSRGVPAARRENIVLFVGAIQKRKNIARLVRAFERMPSGWRLALAGASDGYGAAEELQSVESSLRRTDIDVLGYVTDAQRDELYQRASIFAFPSLDEGFGMPILDAMANGVPVVTSRASAMPEVAGDAALLVNPFDEEELGDAMCRLASEDGLREELIRRGIERAGQFTWERAVQRTWHVYQTLLPGLGE